MSAINSILKLAPLNPILLRVVTAGGRRLRHAFTRWGYLGLLILVLLVALVAANGKSTSLSSLAKSASQVFSAISYVQLGMICLLAPVFCAAAITQERDSRTYNILLSTPLSNAQIVLGSLLSRLYYVVALLLSGAPVFAITLLYGGVTASNIVLSFSIALSTALFTGSLAIAIAVFRLGSGKTVFWFYVFNAIYLVAVYLLDAWWLRLDPATGAAHTTALTAIHPFLALESVVSSTSYPTPELSSLAGVGFLHRWYVLYPAHMYVAITTLASLVLVVPSAIVLRRIAQRSEASFLTVLGNLLRRGKEAKGRRPRTVWANPVAWREAATRAGFSGRGLMRWVTMIVGAGAALALLYAYHTKRLNVEEARTALMGLVVVEFSVSLLVATNTAAAAVTKERESQTLDLLLVTPITSRYYIWGKLRGLVSFMLPFAAVPTMMISLIVLYDAAYSLTAAGRGHEWMVWPETVVTMPLLLTTMLAWACMLGLQLSLKWSRTIVAVMASVAVLAGICSVLGVCGFTAAAKLSGFGVFMSAFSPYTALCVLVNPHQVAETAFGPTGTFSAGAADGLPEWSGRLLLVMAIVCSTVTYCLIVWAMYRSMVKNFDMIIRRQHQ